MGRGRAREVFDLRPRTRGEALMLRRKALGATLRQAAAALKTWPARLSEAEREAAADPAKLPPGLALWQERLDAWLRSLEARPGGPGAGAAGAAKAAGTGDAPAV